MKHARAGSLRLRPAARLRHVGRTLALSVLAASVPQSEYLQAQIPPPSVSISDFGVDTSDADVGAIVRLLRSYLANPDTSRAARTLWLTADTFDQQFGDLHRGFAYQGVPATIIGVLSAGPGDSVYVAKIIYATADSARRQIRPVALQRLYVVRAASAEHGWQLSNALPRLTRDWPTRRVGRITFHYAPGQHVDRERANLAMRFVDSVAQLFALPPPE